MKRAPDYFETIRRKAAARWDQLEQDHELAGPWHQLFKQVQSPRHIVSELLQNADDAGARRASVRLDDNCFVFEHDGEDFAEEHFASLCRFGYSNKRALHTIGFRGIGFKSTFSLGNKVELYTPTLSICFESNRFTEPIWVPRAVDTGGKTQVRVEISDSHRRREVEKNLEEWLGSPVSLLFFRNIRRLQVGDKVVEWTNLGPGPIANSDRVTLGQADGDFFLLIRSEEEPFPPDALEEIRQERMIDTQGDSDFPPCRVEIVMGAKGLLYVVLPTGVETELPFACNAPFIQDPARLKIKDPETSPTNRWLLERAGRLAAAAMLEWLNKSESPPGERAAAYGLLPDVNRANNTLLGVCGTVVEEAFGQELEGRAFLLTETETLVEDSKCVAIPGPILEIWPHDQAAAMLDDARRPSLSHEVSASDRRKLLRWGFVEEIDKAKFLAILQKRHLPEPKTWRQLLNLWSYVAADLTSYRQAVVVGNVNIIPVQGKNVLHSANEVVRLGEKKLLQSESDWEFLSNYLLVLNPNWVRFLADQRRAAAEKNQAAAKEAVEGAFAVLSKIGLESASDVSDVVNQVARKVFSQQGLALPVCVQLAQIAAKLGAGVRDAFRFVTRDLHVRPANAPLFYDVDGSLEDLIPVARHDTQILHSGYSESFTSCSRDEWVKWVGSGAASLLAFVPLSQKRTSVFGRRQAELESRARGVEGDLSYWYVTSSFVLDDWDFDDAYWEHWNKLATADEAVWSKLVERIVDQKDGYWSQATAARISQVATTGRTASVTPGTPLPGWVLKFRSKACLRDTRGFRRKPDELLRRTPETESLMDVEPFVEGKLDREATRPLLDLLGVRSTPTGPDRLLDILRALAKADKPPIHEVEKWYRRLDQMLDACSTADSQKIKQAFLKEKLVFTQDGAWAIASAAFLAADDEDVPGAAVIRASASDLALWRKIGVADRPTADLAIKWLKGLPSGGTLTQDDLRRVRAFMVRHPLRIWEECGHWLNLNAEWVSVEGLAYSISMQSLVPWSHLHPWVKQKTADLQRMPGEVVGNQPFSQLSPLSGRIEERFQKNLFELGEPVVKDWLRALGAGLSWVELEAEDETSRVRELSLDLAATQWVVAPKLEIIPYIDGTPAGTPRRADVVWLDQSIYVENLSKAKLARRVPEEIGKVFARKDIQAALDYSYERSAADVLEYLEENFKLTAQVDAPAEQAAASTGGAAVSSRASPAARQTTNDAPAVSGDESPSGPGEDAPDDNQPAALIAVPDVAEAENTGSEHPPVDPGAEAVAAPRAIRKPPKPSIIERFASAEGFRKDGDGRFFHDSGSWIARTHEDRFPWERRTAGGDLMRYYWPKDLCLENEALQLEADLWSMIEQHPDTYALILANTAGAPVEVTGSQLRAMRDKGQVTIYPASYRLVYEHDHKN
jgi:hypothetical protein